MALNIKKYSIQYEAWSGVLVNKTIGVISVATQLTANTVSKRFQIFLKGHIKNFRKGCKSLPHL